MIQSFRDRIDAERQRFELYLSKACESREDNTPRLWESMRYSLLAGGKRVRPMLLILTGLSFGLDREELYPFAAALEMVHTYSLIHDDLPAMDNDDYRRGRLTNHKVYGEAGAILAGDGLLSQAFVILAEELKKRAGQPRLTGRISAYETLARGCGPDGMVAGQVSDLAAEETTVSLEELRYIERLKTGCLLVAPLVMAAQIAEAPEETVEKLREAGSDMGCAFQIWDDVLDVEGDTATMGKAAHSDEASGKATFVSCFGLERAKEEAARLTTQALQKLAVLEGEEGAMVRQLVGRLITRNK